MQIENCISSCSVCKQHDTAQCHTPLTSGEIPDHPWQIIDSDIFHSQGAHCLLNIDYYSKWVNVSKPEDWSTKASITEFTKKLADFGRVGVIRSDNGPPYKSTEFKTFIKQIDITHKTFLPKVIQG